MEWKKQNGSNVKNVYISYIDSLILISVGTEMVYGKVVFM